MTKHATVSNDVMSSLSDIRYYLIVLNDFVSLKNSFFYVIEDYSYMCTRDVMLFYRNKG